MEPEQIRAAVAKLDVMSWSEEERAWDPLRPLGIAVVPYLREAYRNFRKWRGRVSLVYHALPYGRESEDAFQLGLAALRDRSTMVRYRACGLLAYALRKEALQPLERLIEHPDPKTVEDARAAIDAILSCNHHFFRDRDHSGNLMWGVKESDFD